MIYFDTETHLIKQGLIMPSLVCVTYVIDNGSPGLMDRQTGLARTKEWLSNPLNKFVGQHVAYDFGVLAAEDPSTFLPLIFRAYTEGRVYDTKIRQQLVDIANGELKFRSAEEGEEEDDDEEQQIQHILRTQYSLEALAWRLLRVRLPKEGTWRLKYALLKDTPIDLWPEEAKEYAIRDAITTRDVFLAQQTRYTDVVFNNSAKQHQAAWALHLMSAWGVRTEEASVKKLRSHLEEEHSAAIKALSGTKILKLDGTRSMEAIRNRVVAGYAKNNMEVPKTKTGKVSTAGDVLLASGDPDLKVLAESMKGAKLLNTYVPILEHGVKYPINASFNVLVETGRTSCAKPNLQNPPRKGGVRECFTARPGYVWGTVDFDTIELRTLAQTTIDMGCKYRFMADALCAGEDLHLNLAADVLGIDRKEAAKKYKAGDKIVDEYRQLCKIANFGYPGGMAARTFVEYAAGYGVKISQETAKGLHSAWKNAWREMEEYFEKIKEMIEIKDPVNDLPTICHFMSERFRGDVTFTSAANSFFQGRAADGAKDALWEVTRECFNTQSPLYGCHPVIFMHDEIVTEIPYADPIKASNAIKRQAEVMIATMQRWVPDIPITATPVLFKRWYKGAKPVYDQAGNILPAKPVTEEGKIKWLPDLEQAATSNTTSPSVPTAGMSATSTSIGASASL